MTYQKLCLLVLVTVALSACGDKKVESNLNQKPTKSDAVTETDKWLGQWNGPEGTFLKLSGSNGKYEIIIQNLDGPQHYLGIGGQNEITFERNGAKEKIHATTGSETGMKWLSEKHNCLTIKPGEGFCRD